MKFILALLSCIILFNFKLLSQDSLIVEPKIPVFYIGAFLGLNFNIHNADFGKLPGYPSCCPQFTGGSGMGYAIGIATDYPLSDKFSLDTRFAFTSLNGLMTKQQVIGNTEIRDANPPYETSAITDAISEYEIDASIQAIGLETAIKYEFNQGFSVLTGLRFGFLHSSTFNQKEKLISPNNVVFKENYTLVRNEFKLKDIPETNTLQLHYLIGLSYKTKFKNSITIEPNFRYYMPFTNISSVNWSVSQLQLSVAAMFPLYKPIEVRTIREEIFNRDTSVIYIVGLNEQTVNLVSTNEELKSNKISESTILEQKIINEKYELRMPKESILLANIQAIGINEDGSETPNPKIVIEETEIYETFPLLPYIFFSENDANLVNTAQKLLKNYQTKDFKESSIEQNTYEVYYNLLNVIGSRMLDNPHSKITIVGTNNNSGAEKRNIKLSKERAEVVKDYLVNIWNIDARRISLDSRNLPKKHANNDYKEGLEENRRAEIYSDDFELLKPITILELEKSATPPQIKLIPNITSDLGIKKWDIGIYQDKQVIRKFTDKDDKLIWDIENGIIPALEKPIDIELTVEDVSGKKESVVKSLEIKQLTIKKKRDEFVDDKRIEKFALILFDYDRAELKQEHKQILQDIRARIKPESIVTISGYADGTGEKEYNKDLSSRRTKNVLKELNLPEDKAIIKNIGSDQLLFDNSTSYGRSFCRTVTILIETPIKAK
ncbi:MAG TPA: OmpA family protein [Candidatus Kapabacteria bacterium]|nr:OmpA family protein [Candidatus Kapabacteria bacterium]